MMFGRLRLVDPNHLKHAFQSVDWNQQTEMPVLFEYKDYSGIVSVYPDEIDVRIEYNNTTIIFWFVLDPGCNRVVNNVSLFLYRDHRPTFPFRQSDVPPMMHVVQAAKMAFNRIHHGYANYDHEMEDPIFKEIVLACEQPCNQKTANTLRRMLRIRRMNKDRIWKFAVRFLREWKEHYYNPDNENGFVLTLNKKYSHKF